METVATEVETEKKVIIAERYKSGYNITTITGRYTGPVTSKDIADKFYDPFFGGRSASASNGTFSVIVHND